MTVIASKRLQAQQSTELPHYPYADEMHQTNREVLTRTVDQVKIINSTSCIILSCIYVNYSYNTLKKRNQNQYQFTSLSGQSPDG